MTTMPPRGWIRAWIVAAVLVLALIVVVALGIWSGWDLKTLIGWKPLVDYINPKNATDRKDAVQVYAVFVAGGIAAITAAVGLLNLRLTRRNLVQQRELEEQRADEQRTLEAQRAQATALQAYYEQVGKLLSDKELRTTQREEIRELARGQTLTVLQDLDASRKRSLLTFLYGAGLIGAENPAVELAGADLRDANLQGTFLQGANLQEANLYGADLRGANLYRASLYRAYVEGAMLTDSQLKSGTELLQGALLVDGRKYEDLLKEDLLKDEEGSGKDVENE
jgi:uncharacterized protein YjbI with pentapeptide repeats